MSSQYQKVRSYLSSDVASSGENFIATFEVCDVQVKVVQSFYIFFNCVAYCL